MAPGPSLGYLRPGASGSGWEAQPLTDTSIKLHVFRISPGRQSCSTTLRLQEPRHDDTPRAVV